ncbi:hypothetical protein AVEN_54081-1 [Araneus ventricosus]|uniref:Thyroglobulin type-1 domain-containing protein n=1 Tax=Araneus ventricosus TaxID=182803 RepID=A0A4Y2ICP1_ARAVE|nr:hypothetical protein AVEN_54081-1 [Araneus ventricosus]
MFWLVKTLISCGENNRFQKLHSQAKEYHFPIKTCKVKEKNQELNMSRKFLFVALALAVILHVVIADSQCQKDRAQALQDMQNGNKVGVVPRCKSNGNYKRAQCDLTKGVCHCVDPKTGERLTADEKGGTHCKPS